MRRTHLITILVLLALTLPATPAHAGGVVSVCDEAHLLAALAGGGTVTFACSGTITLTDRIIIAADTTLDGSGQAVTISGNNTVQVFWVRSEITLNLSNLTIANGKTAFSGGGVGNNGTFIVRNSIFSGNSAGQAGGGIYNGEYATLTVNNSTFSGNSAIDWGGAIYNRQHGKFAVSNGTFFSNSAGSGGGIYIQNPISLPLTLTLTIDNSIFTGNSAIRQGGAIRNTTRLTVRNSTFSDNRAALYGGAIDSENRLVVNNSTFSGNHADRDGGAIRSTSFGDGLAVSSSTFFGNSANLNGGGLWHQGYFPSDTAAVSNSSFSGNTASMGGGIYGDGGTLTVSNSTIAGNGGASGGGVYAAAGTLNLKNAIVASSLTGGNCHGTITNGGGNLSYPDTTCPGINADPKLGPLQNNGGPTRTMALGPGSAAIDAGIDATCAAAPVNNRDQRGFFRPWGPHCDIGAVEQGPHQITWFPDVRAR